jgi:hypothetical protein
MYRFPAEFAGSDLCWRGEVLWEGAGEQFEPLVNNATRCRTLRPEDIGRRIFGVSIGPHADLAMTLNANGRIMLRRSVDAAATLIGVAGVLSLLVRWRPRRMVLPLLFAALAIIVIVFTDITFIGGYRPFDGGDDGLIFSGFARVMLAALTNGDPMGVLEGAEKVYGFTAGMRYFRMIEFLVFGDSFLGYLLLMLALPLVVWRLCARFVGVEWGLAFALLFMAPAGVLFGTTYTHYVIWAARGYADPLGAMAFLSGLLLLSGPAGQSFDDRVTRAFWGACLMAFAVVIRPNLALGAGVILGGVALAALWQRQAARLAALCAGFTPVLFPLWHNWHFGGVIVPFSDILTNANIYMVPPVTYWNALQEVGRLELTGANIARIVRHLGLWLSGPSEMAIMVPVHIAAIAILIRVACARSFEPMLRLTALAALALIPPAFVYLIAVRYHLALWLLAAVVSTAWIKYEGLALADARWPGLRERIAATRAAALASRGLTRLMAWT